MSVKAFDPMAKQLLSIILNAAGIVLVVIGFVFLLSFSASPTGTQVVENNFYPAISALLIGLIFLVAAFVLTITQLRKPKPTVTVPLK